MTDLQSAGSGRKPPGDTRTSLRVFYRKQLLLRRGALLTQWSNLFPKHHFSDLRIDLPAPLRPKPPAPRPTPQVTVEAIMLTVRERGISALQELDNIERLSRCDAAAMTQINTRIQKLINEKRIIPND